MISVYKLLDYYIIDESIHLGGSFKIRGLAQLFRSNRMLQLHSPYVTFTSGNHGIAVALLAKQAKVPSVAVVPDWIENDKKNLLQRLGCNIIFGGDSATECEIRCSEIANELNGTLLHPYRSLTQISGYTTLWNEISLLFPEGVDVVVPVGSGALFASGILYRQLTNARLKIVGIEPSDCPSMSLSLNNGKPTEVSSRSMIVPALNVNTVPNEWFHLIRSSQDCELVNIMDEETLQAIAFLDNLELKSDPAFGCAFAFLLFHNYQPKYGKTAIILTGRGGNNSSHQLEEHGIISKGRVEYLKQNVKNAILINSIPIYNREIEEMHKKHFQEEFSFV
jgi:threonine dehydratase